MMLPDVVYPLKDGSNSDELRYSLRSLKNIPHGKVFIVGKVPEWATNVIQIDRKEYDWAPPHNAFIDAEARWMSACEDPRVSEEFLAFNDDFFVMKPIERLPVLYKGLLTGGGRTTYQVMISRTASILAAHSTTQRNYGLHIPMLMSKEKRRALNLVFQNNIRRGQIYLMRSLYGNLFGIGGQPALDCKNLAGDWDKETFLSTNEETFKGKIGEYIKQQFTEKSVYEY